MINPVLTELKLGILQKVEIEQESEAALNDEKLKMHGSTKCQAWLSNYEHYPSHAASLHIRMLTELSIYLTSK